MKWFGVGSFHNRHRTLLRSPLPERSTARQRHHTGRMHDQIEQMLASGLARSRHSSADLSVMIMPAWEERSAPRNSALVDNSLACQVVGLRLWESQDKADDGHITPLPVFRRRVLFEDELADFSAFFGSLEWFREIPDQITARRKGHTSPTYRGAVRLDNNREAFR